jgi:NAD(P)-dependent dehydrogenase (short-subunit alcohol dehydrogenase family)
LDCTIMVGLNLRHFDPPHMKAHKHWKRLYDYLISTVPLGRLGKPDEIAKAAVFLASVDASFVAGVELFVDGGSVQV